VAGKRGKTVHDHVMGGAMIENLDQRLLGSMPRQTQKPGISGLR